MTSRPPAVTENSSSPTDKISVDNRPTVATDVARRWFGGLPRRPRPEHEALENLAGQMDAIANELSPTFEAHGARMRDRARGNNGVGLWARRIAVVLRRLAISEQGLGAPVWSPGEEEPIAIRGLAQAEPQMSTAELDAFSLFMFGDLLIEAIASEELLRLRGARGSWTDYLDWLDGHPGDPSTVTARELNWVLRAARNRLVSHRGDEFDLSVAVAGHGGLHLASLGPPTEAGDRAYKQASAIFQQLAVEVGMEHGPDWEFAELLDLVAYAGAMNADQRKRAYSAFALAGYGSIDLEVVARLLRDLTLEHARASNVLSPHVTFGDAD